MTDLVLIRHGETVWHHDNRYTGRSDVALTELGHRQAATLARWAGEARPDALWVSPLSRARDTARPTAEATGLPVRVDERLMELDFGQGEGLTGAEMSERFPQARAAFVVDPVKWHLPDGEDPVHTAERMAACAAEAVRAHPGGTVLLVGHSTAHRLLLCHLLGLPLSSYRRVFPGFRNCALTTVRWDGGEDPAALIEYNLPVR